MKFVYRDGLSRDLKWNVESPIGANIFSNVTKKGGKGTKFLFRGFRFSLPISEFILSIPGYSGKLSKLFLLSNSSYHYFGKSFQNEMGLNHTDV